MNPGKALRTRRIAAGIPTELLAFRLKTDRTRISRIERELESASEDQMAKINAALDELIVAKREMQACAERVGWPVGVSL